MSEAKRCRQCGESGPTTFFRQGNARIGVCANQHKISEEPIGNAPFEHERLSNWIKRLKRSTWRETISY